MLWHGKGAEACITSENDDARLGPHIRISFCLHLYAVHLFRGPIAQELERRASRADDYWRCSLGGVLPGHTRWSARLGSRVLAQWLQGGLGRLAGCWAQRSCGPTGPRWRDDRYGHWSSTSGNRFALDCHDPLDIGCLWLEAGGTSGRADRKTYRGCPC